MAERYDKLGRRIPEFDRSAANKKGNATKKEMYGPDYHARIGADGGRLRTRGYFGKLKDEGKEAELKALSKKATEALRAKKAKASKNKAVSTRGDTPVSRGR